MEGNCASEWMYAGHHRDVGNRSLSIGKVLEGCGDYVCGWHATSEKREAARCPLTGFRGSACRATRSRCYAIESGSRILRACVARRIGIPRVPWRRDRRHLLIILHPLAGDSEDRQGKKSVSRRRRTLDSFPQWMYRRCQRISVTERIPVSPVTSAIRGSSGAHPRAGTRYRLELRDFKRRLVCRYRQRDISLEKGAGCGEHFSASIYRCLVQ